MVITLYGSDSYRRKKKLDEIVARFLVRQVGSAYEVIDGEEEGATDRARTFLGTPSLFQDAKLLVWHRALMHAGDAWFKKLMKDLTSRTEVTVVISDGTKQIKKDLAFLKEKPNPFQEFTALPRAQFISFIREEAEVRKLNLAKEVADYLSDVYAADSWGVVTELDKLSLVENRPVTRALLASLGVRPESDFFSSISGWFRKNTRERLRALEDVLAAKHDPAKVFSVMSYLDPRELRRCADYDVEIKSGKLEYEEALLELALQH